METGEEQGRVMEPLTQDQVLLTCCDLGSHPGLVPASEAGPHVTTPSFCSSEFG